MQKLKKLFFPSQTKITELETKIAELEFENTKLKRENHNLKNQLLKYENPDSPNPIIFT